MGKGVGSGGATSNPLTLSTNITYCHSERSEESPILSRTVVINLVLNEKVMIRISPTELNLSSWLLASLIYDSIWPLKNKLYTNETNMLQAELYYIKPGAGYGNTEYDGRGSQTQCKKCN